MLKPNESSTSLTKINGSVSSVQFSKLENDTNFVEDQNLNQLNNLLSKKTEKDRSPMKESSERLAKISKLSGVVGFLAEKWLSANKPLQTSFTNEIKTETLNLNYSSISSKELFNSKEHDETLASTSTKSENSDNSDEGVVLNTDVDFTSQPFLHLFTHQKLTDDTKNKNSDNLSETDIQKGIESSGLGGLRFLFYK